MRRLAPQIAPLFALALLVSGCGVTGDDAITVSATFDDVIDLVPQASVRAGDVTIGEVESIELSDGMEADVTMSVEGDTGLPSEVQARLARTSLLGERYVDLVPLDSSGTLENGTDIENTTVLTNFEDLVATGDQALSLVAADSVNAALQTGAVAFGGRGGLIGSFIENVDGVLGRYNEEGDVLVDTIDALDDLTEGLEDDAQINAEGIAVLEEASNVLEEEDDRLLDALDEVTELSKTGERILAEHRVEIEDAVRRLRIFLAELTRVDGAIENILTWAPRHNLHVPNGVIEEQGSGNYLGQVWLDFIVCGVNDTEGDPSRDCDPPNPGTHFEDPPGPRSEACYDDLEVCREETDEAKARS